MSIMIENLFCHLKLAVFLALGVKPEGSSKPDLYSSIITPIYSILLDMPSEKSFRSLVSRFCSLNKKVASMEKVTLLASRYGKCLSNRNPLLISYSMFLGFRMKAFSHAHLLRCFSQKGICLLGYIIFFGYSLQ